DGVGRARALLDHRHFPERGPGVEDGQRLLTHPRELAGDPYPSLDDDVHRGAGLSLTKDVLPARNPLRLADAGEVLQLGLGQPPEQRHPREQVEIHGIRGTLVALFPPWPTPCTQSPSSARGPRGTPPPSTPPGRTSSPSSMPVGRPWTSPPGSQAAS